MSQFFHIHPENPQPRLINQAVAVVRHGGLIIYPTDSGYALGCHLDDKEAADRMRKVRSLDKAHNFTLVCRDLSEIANYARVDNATFRLLKNATPGAYTFILHATDEVPRRLQHPKRKTIGIRVPKHKIVWELLEALGEPLMSTSLILPGLDALSDPIEIRDRLEHQVDLVINGGYCGHQPTTVVDLTVDGDTPQILRVGQGDPTPFQT